jgi:NADPH:quinone reductase-like Zn-dependent oxidoreductase
MKAVVLETRTPDGVYCKDVAQPTRKTNEALIKMEAASLNRVDLYMRDNGAGITHDLPLIMGVDGVGRIVEIDNHPTLKVGQRVILYPYVFCGICEHCLQGEQPLCLKAKIPGEHRDGTFAQYITMPSQSLLPISETCNVEEAATLGVAYLTAWRMIFNKANASAGKTALIVGAGGGVSAACVQLAKLAGCRVIASTSGANKINKVKEAGADFVIDYKSEDTVKKVMAITEKSGVDFVIDNVGEATWSSSIKSVKRGGRLITCGATTGSHPSADLQRLFIRQISIHGSTMGSLEEFKRIIDVFERGQLKPIIDQSFPLDQFKHAFDRLENPDRFGKVVLTL